MVRFRKTKIKYRVRTVNLADLETENLVDALMGKVATVFLDEIGPQIVDNAKQRVPVSVDRHADGQKFNRASFRSLELKPLGSFGPAREGMDVRASYLEALHGLLSTPRRTRGGRPLLTEEGDIVTSGLPAVARRLRLGPTGRTRNPVKTQYFQGKGKNKGLTPDEIGIMAGTVKGAFGHRPGTLRDSIHVAGVDRVGNKVILSVVASAPYAAAVHEGFTHRGGRAHDGSSTKVGPNKYLSSTIPVIRERLVSPSTYTG